jgi:diguanylate cyclase (GGDEF)-like protein
MPAIFNLITITCWTIAVFSWLLAAIVGYLIFSDKKVSQFSSTLVAVTGQPKTTKALFLASLALVGVLPLGIQLKWNIYALELLSLTALLSVACITIRLAKARKSISEFAETLFSNIKFREVLEALLANTDEGVIVFSCLRNEKGEVVEFFVSLVNRSAHKIFGIEDGILGQRFNSPDQIKGHPELWGQFIRSANGEILTKTIIEPGNKYYRVRSFPAKGDVGVTIQNITKLMRRADIDPLTGAFNRGFLARPEIDKFTCLIYLDIKRFGLINSSYSQEIGDKCLIEIASRLSKIEGCRTIRMGGDQFLLILTAPYISSRVTALRFAQHALASIKVPILIGSASISLDAKMGVFYRSSRSSETNLKQGIRFADMALSEASKPDAAFSRWIESISVFSPEMEGRAMLAEKLEQALRHGEDVESQLKVYYQRVVNLSTLQTVGMEALVRWHHPEYGTLPPNLFIPIAERSGTIHRVTSTVMDQIGHVVSRWSEYGVQFKVGVNISTRDIEREGFVSAAKSLAKQAAGTNASLILEITESGQLDVLGEWFLSMSKMISSLGFSMAIDDAGTGFNSLSMISEIGQINRSEKIFGFLKLDKRFVSGPLANMNVCNLLLKLSREMDMVVIAEGIETAEQADQLNKIGVPWGQGYWFEDGKPMPEPEMTRLLEREWGNA